jgi:hypothetical protein
VSNQGVDPQDYTPRNWVWTTELPTGGDGGAMFATDDDFGGNCTTNDQSAVLRLVSPLITVPDGGLPVLLIDHYVATEPAADGGNLKISVNGGPFQLVPEGAFLFNPYNQVLDGPPVNHNPLAGQPAFSGLNETLYRGSWGQSQVNLRAFVGPATASGCASTSSTAAPAAGRWYLDGFASCSPTRAAAGAASSLRFRPAVPGHLTAAVGIRHVCVIDCVRPLVTHLALHCDARTNSEAKASCRSGV